MKYLPNNILAANQSFYRDWARQYEEARTDGLRGMYPEVKSGKYDMSINGLLMATVPEYIRGWMNATGYDDIALRARELAVSDKTDILIGINSGGGYIYGIDQAIESLKALRDVKNIVVEVGEMAASAAYWLAAIGHTIRVNRFSQVGGIGIYTIIDDDSEKYADMGVKRMLVSSGEHKGAGQPGVPVPESTIEIEQERVNAIAANFFADINLYRELDESIMSGRTWIGDQSITVGLADEIYGITRSKEMSKKPVAEEATPEEETKEEPEEKAEEMEEKEEEEKEEAKAEEMEEKEDDVSAERARAASIASAFAHCPEFANKHILAGSTLVEAKADWFDYEGKDNKPAGKASRVVPANQPPKPAATNWSDALRDYAAANKCSLSEAGAVLAKTRPDLYRQNF